MRTPEERFAVLSSFLGFGFPDARIWFIGLEEAGEWNKNWLVDEEKYLTYAKGSFPFADGEIASDAREYGRKYTKVYDIMSKLIVAAQHDLSPSDWKAYRDQRLLVEGGDAFQANLYPLGKPSLPFWPEHYASVFGLNSRVSYRTAVRDHRFRLLRSAHTRYAPKVTICFGKAGWDDFSEVLGLEGEPFDDSIASCRIYLSRGVVLTPFFRYPYLCQRTIDDLGQRLSLLLAR